MGIFSAPKAQQGPSAAQIQAQADAAAAQERKRLEQEQAQKDQEAKDKGLASLKDQEAKRAAFAGVLTAAQEEDAGRKKFLKGV
jgi:hypothetical protein